MNEYLKSVFNSEEIALAAAIGTKELALVEKIDALFRELGDPLLSADDVQALLASDASDEIARALNTLLGESILESSTATLRPKDSDGVVLYRRKGFPFSRLRLVAVEARLSDGSVRYQFTCDGRLLRNIARIDRLDALSDTGQQREEINAHVDRISQGIRSGIQIPNSVLLVLLKTQLMEDSGDDTAPHSFILFRPLQDEVRVAHPVDHHALVQDCRLVQLDFPYRQAAFDDEKAALLVDGQQRTAALSFVDIDAVPLYQLSVIAVVADEEEAKSVFQVANSTVKISTQFSRALTASMGDAPGYLREEQRRAKAVKILSLLDHGSPFCGLIQYPGMRLSPRPPVAYNSLFQVVSTFDEGGIEFETAEELAGAVKRAFSVVKTTWPDAWGLKPDRSRLMHGVGLRSLAALLISKLEQVVVSDKFDGDYQAEDTWRPIGDSLTRLKDVLVWTEEAAGQATKSAGINWREQISNRQNTNQDIAQLTSFLKKESLHLDTEAQKKRRSRK